MLGAYVHVKLSSNTSESQEHDLNVHINKVASSEGKEASKVSLLQCMKPKFSVYIKCK